MVWVRAVTYPADLVMPVPQGPVIWQSRRGTWFSLLERTGGMRRTDQGRLILNMNHTLHYTLHEFRKSTK